MCSYSDLFSMRSLIVTTRNGTTAHSVSLHTQLDITPYDPALTRSRGHRIIPCQSSTAERSGEAPLSPPRVMPADQPMEAKREV